MNFSHANLYPMHKLAALEKGMVNDYDRNAGNIKSRT